LTKKMVEKLILGTVQLGMSYGVNNSTGMPSETEAEAILNSCWEKHLHTLDTAEAYGVSQEILGHYFRKNQDRRFKVISKFSFLPGESSSIQTGLERTLETLGISSVDGYLFHRAQDFFDSQARKTVVGLKNKGAIKQIGVSVYGVDEAEKIVELGGADIIQMPFNLLDNWSRRGKAITQAQAAGVSVHVRSVFLQGLFFKPTESLSAKLKPLAPALERLRAIAKQAQVEVNEMALRYALGFSEIDRVLIGVEKEAQLHKNLSCLKGPLSKETVDAINRIELENPQLLDPRCWS